MTTLSDTLKQQVLLLKELPLEQRVLALNELRALISQEVSPFSSHPVDNVQWVPAAELVSNDYNPNSVADPEMKLLEVSLQGDGFTQPIVGFKSARELEVVDGFHRTSLIKGSAKVSESTLGYAPVAFLSRKLDKEARMAATVRHNRARGVHGVEAMSKIVQDLARRGWDDAKIARELGMEAPEITRLRQTLGIAELYSKTSYSFAWEPVEPRT